MKYVKGANIKEKRGKRKKGNDDRRSETQKEECERCLTNRVKMRVPEGIAVVENTLNKVTSRCRCVSECDPDY